MKKDSFDETKQDIFETYSSFEKPLNFEENYKKFEAYFEKYKGKKFIDSETTINKLPKQEEIIGQVLNEIDSNNLKELVRNNHNLFIKLHKGNKDSFYKDAIDYIKRKEVELYKLKKTPLVFNDGFTFLGDYQNMPAVEGQLPKKLVFGILNSNVGDENHNILYHGSFDEDSKYKKGLLLKGKDIYIGEFSYSEGLNVGFKGLYVPTEINKDKKLTFFIGNIGFHKVVKDKEEEEKNKSSSSWVPASGFPGNRQQAPSFFGSSNNGFGQQQAGPSFFGSGNNSSRQQQAPSSLFGPSNIGSFGQQQAPSSGPSSLFNSNSLFGPSNNPPGQQQASSSGFPFGSSTQRQQASSTGAFPNSMFQGISKAESEKDSVEVEIFIAEEGAFCFTDEIELNNEYLITLYCGKLKNSKIIDDNNFTLSYTIKYDEYSKLDFSNISVIKKTYKESKCTHIDILRNGEYFVEAIMERDVPDFIARWYLLKDKSVFIGSLVNKGNIKDLVFNFVLEGPGLVFLSNQDIYKGIFKNNKKEDPNGKYFVTSSMHYTEAVFKEDNIIKGKVFLANQQQFKDTDSEAEKDKYILFCGTFKDNEIKDGKYFYRINQNQVETYDGIFEKSKRSGKGTYYYINGCIYVGEWKDDFKDGEGRYFEKVIGQEKPNTYSGIWKRDILEEITDYELVALNN